MNPEKTRHLREVPGVEQEKDALTVDLEKRFGIRTPEFWVVNGEWLEYHETPQILTAENKGQQGGMVHMSQREYINTHPSVHEMRIALTNQRPNYNITNQLQITRQIYEGWWRLVDELNAAKAAQQKSKEPTEDPAEEPTIKVGEKSALIV